MKLNVFQPHAIVTDLPSAVFAPEGALLYTPDCDARVLSPGDAYKFTFENLMQLRTDHGVTADFSNVVSYVPILPAIRMQSCTHFVVYKDAAGHNQWFRAPGGICCKFPWLHF